MSAEMPKMPEPVYIFWSADTLHIRLWTADPERAARFAADTGATATVYVPKQEVQEAARQAMEQFERQVSEWMHVPTLKLRAGEMTAQEVRTVIGVLGAIRALIPQDPDQSEKRHG